MKILHISAAEMSPTAGGIVIVLKNLTDIQNRVEGVESRVLSVIDRVNNVQSGYFDHVQMESVSAYIENFRPDFAIFHSFFHIEYARITKVLAGKRIPYFIEPHSSFGKQAMNKSRIKKIVANNTVFRFAIKSSLGFIFLNEAELNDSIYRTSKDLVIPNGVDPDIIDNTGKKPEESFEYPTIYYMGRYDKHHKGLDFLFDAFDILETKGLHARIRLYGTGSIKQNKYVSDRILDYKSLDIADCGPVLGKEKKAALESGNIMILTSRYEGFPMSVLEAWASGNPCIVTPGTNLADEITNNDLGWQCELSADSIAVTIIKALDDYRSNVRDYYERCRKYVFENYSWDRIGRDSIEQYKKALNNIRP